MERFDVARRLKILTEGGALQYDYDAQIEVAISHNALRNFSRGFAAHAAMAIIVGLEQDAGKLLAKAKHWMECAMERRELARGFELESERFHRHLYSTIRWLLDGVHDRESLATWVSQTMESFRKHPSRLSGAELGFEAVKFIDAGAYQDYLVLAAPAGIEAVKCSGANEKQMALTLAVQALTQKFPEEKVQAAVKKFLDKHVGEWLNNGHAVRAAEWMKVIYWQRGETGLTPFDAVRKCLDHVEH